MKLYFISHEEDGDNFDLFVWANTPSQAGEIWQRHFGFDGTEPNLTFVVPTEQPADPQALGWHTVVKPL
jgi:hypothetical protein